MSRDNAFYKSLGYELIKELAGTYVGAELISDGAPGAYKTVALPNEMHVRFTSWRGGVVVRSLRPFS